MNISEEYIRKLQEENQCLRRFMKASGKEALREMFDSHQAIMLLINANTGQILDLNEAAVKFYKYSKQELLKLNIEDINALPPEDVKRERMKSLNKEKNYFIFPHRLADGTIRQVEVYTSVYVFNNVPTLYSIIHDVTDRVRAQEELKKKEEKFVSAFRSNPNCMIISNMDDGKIYDVNDAFYELTGLPRNSIIDQTTLSINLYVKAEDRDKMIQLLKKNCSIRHLEINLRHCSGKILTVLASVEVLRMSSEKTIITTLLDITERVRLKNELERNNILLQTIIDSVPAMITIYDPNLQKIEINNEFEKITGWTNKDFNKQNAMELVYPDPGYRKIVSEFMQSLKPGFKDFEMTTRNGSKIETIWANVKLNDGRQVGIGIDITERKKMEQELEEKNAFLTGINEAFENFLKIAAHDLRSPIQNLISISNLIDENSTPEDKMHLFNMLVPLTKRLQQTVEGLVETVSLQIQQELVTTPLLFSDLFITVQQELETDIKSFKGKITTDFKEEVIRYIEVYLFSILRNLLSNSIKYSEETENALIEITTEKDGDFILLTVKDNGIGMDLKDDGQNPFKPFQRLTSKAQGIGMGLYIVKKMIERNGGYVRVESHPNKGTVFYCYLKEYTD